MTEGSGLSPTGVSAKPWSTTVVFAAFKICFRQGRYRTFRRARVGEGIQEGGGTGGGGGLETLDKQTPRCLRQFGEIREG